VKLGICAAPTRSADVNAAGFDYIEANAQALLQGLEPDEKWTGREAASASVLPVLACNVMLPGTLRITGSDVDAGRLREYVVRIMDRAQKVGVRTIVFGSAGARNVPDGWDRERAKRQIIDFASMAAPIAQQHGVTITVEPLNRKESNIINFVAEAMEYVRAVDHPGFQCLVDSYHFWLENEPLENLRSAMPWIKHVHVADVVGRVPPGESRQADYRPFLRTLREGGYDGLISIEAGGFDDIAGMGPRVHRYLLDQWNQT
jgi:sugar phosphate isomerase/epimerase